ncbi:unnamed protein product [Cutaneotrichosporon oleaginosum]
MASKDSKALIRFTPVAVNNAASWSSAMPKPNPTLTALSRLDAKLDTLLADHASLRAAHADAQRENERLRAANAELAASVRALGASLADSRAENSARVLYGLRGVEHAAREQRVLLRDVVERLERVEYESAGAIGWGAREAIEGPAK